MSTGGHYPSWESYVYPETIDDTGNGVLVNLLGIKDTHRCSPLPIHVHSQATGSNKQLEKVLSKVIDPSEPNLESPQTVKGIHEYIIYRLINHTDDSEMPFDQNRKAITLNLARSFFYSCNTHSGI